MIAAVDWFNVIGWASIAAVIALGAFVMVRVVRSTSDPWVIVGRATVTIAIILAVVALIGYEDGGDASIAFDDWAYTNVAAAIGIGIVAFLALPMAARNGAVWALVGSSFFSSLQAFGAALALTDGISNSAVQADLVTVAPAEISLAAAIGVNLALWCWMPALFLVTIFGLLLFPDGSVPSPRWRIVGWIAGVTLIVGSAITAVMYRPGNTASYAEINETADPFIGIAMLILFLASLASIVAAVVRWRRSEGDERLRFRWAGGGLILLAAAGIITMPIDTDLFRVVSLIVVPLVFVAYGIAITKHRLYDIDLVVSRTLVYGLLLALIAIVYVAIVAVPLLILGGSQDEGSQPAPVLAIVGTAVIAIAFQPVRRRLERIVNRLVYGKQATPYEVLSDFSRRVAATDDDLLEQVPESLVAGTSAESAAVWLRTGSTWTRTTAFPSDDGPGPVPGFADSGNGLVSVPVEHDGEVMGAVTIVAPRAQRLTADDERLARQVASGMGLALRNQRLTEDLRMRVGELQDSRRRIVAVQDDTRRTLERNLHDGAQQQLVAVKVKLGIARQFADRDGAPDTSSDLERLARDADRAIEEMRTFARGIYPPLLEAEGLVPAITAHARRLPIAVDVTDHGIGRYDRSIESTAYFCLVEALDNISVHTEVATASIELDDDGTCLQFAIADEGPGFDATVQWRTGLTTMGDRIDVLGGALSVSSSPGSGTTVRGTVPVGSQPTPGETEQVEVAHR